MFSGSSQDGGFQFPSSYFSFFSFLYIANAGAGCPELTTLGDPSPASAEAPRRGHGWRLSYAFSRSSKARPLAEVPLPVSKLVEGTRKHPTKDLSGVLGRSQWSI